MANVYVYADGPLCCSVCVPKEWNREQVEREVNAAHPCGTENGWAVSKDSTFASGQTNPCECHDDSMRLHWLLDA